jgi:TetR/AcrR family transcriptional regulator, mexJK operon transcriptional repressor
VRARKADEVLTAARRMFLENGYAGTSVDDVATSAGVSKATVYSNFHDKDALVVAMIDRMTSESRVILERAASPLDDSGPVRARLIQMATSLARSVLAPEVIGLRRLAVSMVGEFPASAAQYWSRGPGATIAMLEDRFETLTGRGELSVADVHLAASQFAYALIGPLQDRAMLDTAFAPDDNEIARHVEYAVDSLLWALD